MKNIILAFILGILIAIAVPAMADTTLVRGEAHNAGDSDGAWSFGDVALVGSDGVDVVQQVGTLDDWEVHFLADMTYINDNVTPTAPNVTTTLPVSGDGSVGDPVTIGADAIKDTEPDWGTGAGQISATDVPVDDGTADTQVLYNNAGAFGYEAAFNYNDGTDTLTMANATIEALAIFKTTQFAETGGGANYFQLSAAVNMAGNNSYLWPDAYPGTAGWPLVSTTGGIMSWGDPAGWEQNIWETITSDNGSTAAPDTAGNVYFIGGNNITTAQGAGTPPVDLNVQISLDDPVDVDAVYLGDASTGGTLRIYDGSSNYITLDVPAMAADWTYTLPAIVPANTYARIQSTDTSGDTTWSTDRDHYESVYVGVIAMDGYSYINNNYQYAATRGFLVPRAGTITGIGVVTVLNQVGIGDTLDVYPYDDGAAVHANCKLQVTVADPTQSTTFTPGTYTYAAGSIMSVYLDLTDVEVEDITVWVEFATVE